MSPVYRNYFVVECRRQRPSFRDGRPAAARHGDRTPPAPSRQQSGNVCGPAEHWPLWPEWGWSSDDDDEPDGTAVDWMCFFNEFQLKLLTFHFSRVSVVVPGVSHAHESATAVWNKVLLIVVVRTRQHDVRTRWFHRTVSQSRDVRSARREHTECTARSQISATTTPGLCARASLLSSLLSLQHCSRTVAM